jgi:hypothetical protein
MNTFQVKQNTPGMLFFLLLLCVTTGFAKAPTNAELAKRVENLNTVVDVRVTDEVTHEVMLLVEKRRTQSETLLGRTSLYFPLIENALREKNLPDELKYIAVIESSLIPYVSSHKGASGMWQFMKATGELFGLKIDKHVDERRDPVKSTEKALDYLKTLYDLYGNWTVAIAAYNCGSGNVNKAIKRAGGSTDYWKIRPYLPKETQKYIPRFIAASYLMTYYYLHDLQPKQPSDDYRFITSVKIFNKVDFAKVSKEFDVDIELLRILNPMYKKDFIPGSEDGQYILSMPEFKMYAFVDKYSSREHITEYPLTINKAAYNEMEAISSAKTYLKHSKDITGVQSVALDNLRKLEIQQHMGGRMVQESESPSLYVMKRKESLKDIAAERNLSLQELMEINNINVETGIAPGSIIRLSR